MTIRFGVSPIAWINDDMPELGGDTPLDVVLGDAQEIGFTGIELGGKFPREPGALKALLDRYGLALVGGWYGSSLLDRTAEAEIEAMQPHLRLLQAMGTDIFVIAETSNAIHSDRARPLSQTPRLNDSEWPQFGRRLTEVADYLASEGMRCAYHHHLGTVVERQEDLDRFLAVTGPAVGLTLDTGHASLGGIDPIEVIRRHPERVTHVHCKDIRAEVFGALARREGSFLDGVIDGMFTVPGEGAIDYGDVMRALAGIGYSGWIIIEAEQDPAVADPRRYGEIGLRTLERAAERAGLERIAA
jgi:inosose dehydratase